MIKWLRIIWFVFGILVFSVILINGLQRCYINYVTEMDHLVRPPEPIPIDLYANSLNQIPKEADTGMTVLIDKGASDLETGIYQIRSNPLPPIKVNMPEVGQFFLITKGPFAGLTHKIKPSFLEVRPPEETQILLDDKTMLNPDTSNVIIPFSIQANKMLDVSNCVTISMRRLQVEIFAPVQLTLTTLAQNNLTIQGPYSGYIYFQYQETKLVWYQQHVILATY